MGVHQQRRPEQPPAARRDGPSTAGAANTTGAKPAKPAEPAAVAKDGNGRTGRGFAAGPRSATSGNAAVQRLSGLQSRAGNAAVVQLVRHTGHPPARDHQQHGPARGHRGQGSHVQHVQHVQRSAQNDSNRAGATLTDPGQGSARTADRDGIAVDAATAPSRTIQRTTVHDAASPAGHPHASRAPAAGEVVQRMESPPPGGRGYDADASSSGSDYDRRSDSSPERGRPATQAGPADHSARHYAAGASNPYPRYEFEPSSSEGEQGGHRMPAPPAAAPAAAPSTYLAREVHTIAYQHVVEELIEGALHEKGHVTDEDRAMARAYGDMAADAASTVAQADSDRYPDNSAEQADFLRRYPLVFGEVFTEHHADLFEGRPRSLAGRVMDRIRHEHNQNAHAAEQGIDLPEHPRLRPLRALIMDELLSSRRSDRKLKVTLNVDQGEGILRGDVGHAWIGITGSGGATVSFGFYPDDGAGKIDSVAGGVVSPDDGHGATHRESKKVELDRIHRGYQIAYSKAQAEYNLTQHNCTTFANEVWQAMTGEAIPRNLLSPSGLIGGTIAPTPAAAAAGLERHQAARRKRRLEQLRTAAKSPMYTTAQGPMGTAAQGPAYSVAQGPMRGFVPGAGTGNADEVADRMADLGLSHSSESQSSEELD